MWFKLPQYFGFLFLTCCSFILFFVHQQFVINNGSFFPHFNGTFNISITSDHFVPAIDQNGSLRYKNEKHNLQATRSFSEKWLSYFPEFGFLEPENSSLWLRTEKSYEPQFVTAFSDDHIKEMLQLLIWFDDFFKNTPSQKLIIYYLESNKTLRASMFGNWSHRIAQLSTFDFDHYPTYVQQLETYRWKAILVAKTLAKHPLVWWMDSSIRMVRKRSPSLKPAIDWTYKAAGCSLLSYNTHNIQGHTHKAMYDFLPMPPNKRKIMMYGANRMLFARCPGLQTVMKWWVLCALEKDCMAPKGSDRKCKNTIGTTCHRFDQSALNVILAVENDFRTEAYYSPVDHPLRIHRMTNK